MYVISFTIAYREILGMQVHRILSRDFLVAGGQFNLTQTFSVAYLLCLSPSHRRGALSLFLLHCKI
jgi:hypothetical protein